MTTFNRRHALALFGAATVAGCAPAVQTAALGDDPFEGGIGGTGIVGVMVGTGSVLIDGLRVEVPDAVRIVDNGGIGGTGALIPGRAMTIVARARRDRLEALRIDVEDPLVGVLRGDRGALSVNGTPVTIEPGAVGGTLIGRRVAVSGVWQAGGGLRASLVRPADGQRYPTSGVIEVRLGAGEGHAVIARHYHDGIFQKASFLQDSHRSGHHRIEVLNLNLPEKRV